MQKRKDDFMKIQKEISDQKGKEKSVPACQSDSERAGIVRAAS